MSWLGQTVFRLQSLFWKKKIEADLTDEIQAHLEAQTEANVAAGMTSEEARYAALREFGGVEQIKEQFRDERSVRWIEDLKQDAHYGVRQLRKNPGFTAIVVLMLALGIGACTAIFSAINLAVIHPLNYPRPDQLVTLRATLPARTPQTASSRNVSIEHQRQAYFAYRQYRPVFANLAAAYFQSRNLTGAGDPIRPFIQHVTANFFATLKVQPALGRDFQPEDQAPGKGAVAILSHRLWLEHFGGRPDVIGRTVSIDEQTVTIVGVMPANFLTGITSPAVYLPITFPDNDRQATGANDFPLIIGRLQEGITLAQANQELNRFAQSRARLDRAGNQGWGVTVRPFASNTAELTRTALYTLGGAVAFLLLIACVNVANLLRARAAARQKELAVRAALGAGRARLIRQLLCENALLAVSGGLCGLIVAHVGMKLLLYVSPVDLPRFGEISVDGPALGFSLVLAMLTGLGFGLVPAFQATRADLNHALRISGSSGQGSAGRRTRPALIALEVALAFILLTGAGLLARSFVNLQNIGQGFQPKDLFWAPLQLMPKKHIGAQAQIEFVQHALEKISHVPGVASVCFVNYRATFLENGNFTIADQPVLPPVKRPTVQFMSITSDYLKATGITLRRGRTFSSQDTASSAPMVLINEEFARWFFPNKDPIGQQLGFALDGGPVISRKIVGIIGNANIGARNGLSAQVPCQVLIPFPQNPGPELTLRVRTLSGVPLDMPAVCAAVHAIEKDLPIGPLYEGVSIPALGQAGVLHFSMVVAVVVSGLALLLAVVGIYGVASYTVAQRTAEFGLRMALGAGPRDVLGLVFRQVGWMVVTGLLGGLAGALALSWLLKPLLFEVSPHEPMTLGVIVLVFSLAAFITCAFAARRATKVDFMTSLRAE